MTPRPRSTTRNARRIAALSAAFVVTVAACGSDGDDAAVTDESAATTPADTTPVESAPADTTPATDAPAETTPATDAAPSDPVVSTRDSGLVVTVQEVGDITVHSLTAPEEVFANTTHVIETPGSLVLFDTQFLLPNALDFRAYVDDLGKPIDRMFITHEHPDHFLGSEAFADVDVYALGAVTDAIAANGDAEVEEKQADFGDAIAGSFVTPLVVEPGTIDIDGVEFILEEIDDAEAEVQLVTRVPQAGAVVTGDIVYSGVHLILAGQPVPWTEALNTLKATSDDYPIVLPGHGLPATPDVYDANIAWLAKAGELIGTVDTAEEFKSGLVEAFPELGMDAAIDFVFPFLFPDTGTDTEAVGATSEVSFGECTELSTGTVTPLAALQAELPDGVTALSLTAQGTVFEGSDDLGVLITRALRCDEIAVSQDGDPIAAGEQHIAHVGTPVDASVLPASPYSNDGVNGADFNNYIFGYYSDSEAYVDALTSAGVTGAAVGEITMTDTPVEDCVVNRAVTVSAAEFSFDSEGEIPDAFCEEPDTPFIANWWSVSDGSAAIASNNIAGQAAIFIDTAATTVNITPTGDGMQRLVGADPVVADAFGVIGLIPPSGDAPTMTITAAGALAL